MMIVVNIYEMVSGDHVARKVVASEDAGNVVVSETMRGYLLGVSYDQMANNSWVFDDRRPN